MPLHNHMVRAQPQWQAKLPTKPPDNSEKSPVIEKLSSSFWAYRYYWNIIEKLSSSSWAYKYYCLQGLRITIFLSDPGPIIVYACQSLTHWLTHGLVEDWMNWPRYADYADHAEHTNSADYAEYAEYVEYADYAEYMQIMQNICRICRICRICKICKTNLTNQT